MRLVEVVVDEVVDFWPDVLLALAKRRSSVASSASSPLKRPSVSRETRFYPKRLGERSAQAQIRHGLQTRTMPAAEVR
jgi:hypothetical protein